MLHRELIGAFSDSSTCKYSGETSADDPPGTGWGSWAPSGPLRTASTRAHVSVGQAIMCFRCSRLLSRAAEPTHGQRFWFSLLVLGQRFWFSPRRALLPLGVYDVLPNLPQLSRPRHSDQSYWKGENCLRNRKKQFCISCEVYRCVICLFPLHWGSGILFFLLSMAPLCYLWVKNPET